MSASKPPAVKSSRSSATDLFGSFSSASSSRINDKNFIMNGGCALQWSLKKNLIIQRFQAAGVLEYLTCPLMDDVALEKKFTELRPNRDDVLLRTFYTWQGRVHRGLDEEWEVFRNTYWHYGADRDAAYEALRAKERDFERRGDEYFTTLESNYDQALARWETRRREHQKEVAKVQEVFMKAIDPTTLALVAEHLRNENFTTAWNTVDQHYTKTVVGTSTIANVLNALYNDIWDINHPMGDHVRKINAMIETAKNVDPTMQFSDQVLRGALCESVRRSPLASDYADVLNHIKYSELSYLDACHQLTNAFEEKRIQTHGFSGVPSHIGSVAVAQSAVQEDDDAEHQDVRRYCRNCGKKHRGRCRLPPLCYRCHKPGHLAQDCGRGGGGGRGRGGGRSGGGGGRGHGGGRGDGQGGGGGTAPPSKDNERSNQSSSSRAFEPSANVKKRVNVKR
jgi:uncharacterized membrane protein YgcG